MFESNILLRFITIIFIFSLVLPSFVLAADELPQETVLEGRVVNVLDQEENQGDPEAQIFVVKLESGDRAGEEVEVLGGGSTQRIGDSEYKEGDRVLVAQTTNLSGDSEFYIQGFVRRNALLSLFVIFVIVTLLVARWRGLTSLIGMAMSFLVIFKGISPLILGGANPVLVVAGASLAIIPLTFFLSHGMNKKSLVAAASTVLSLIVTIGLASLFSNIAHLTGYSSEEAAYLQTMVPGKINFQGLVLAGIIVGVLGVLDDITVAQAAVVQKLREANPRLPSNELFFNALYVGRDHIASMVNTLILVYAGASLPLLLLFVNTSQDLSLVINNQFLAEEIVRTLVGSIGLIFAVPVTTFFAVKAFPRPFSSQS
ncbi:MAG: YibE/F family protein [Patescibacteria group bacterium]|nr:YibE/F family protein [Patescibacteria group bacterium]